MERSILHAFILSSFILPGVLLGLSLYTYQASRVFPLIFGLFLLFVFVQQWRASRTHALTHHVLRFTHYAVRSPSFSPP